MRFAVIDDRAKLQVASHTYIDIEACSKGRFSAAPMDLLNRWQDLRQWAAEARWDDSQSESYSPSDLQPPVPQPGQIFAVGLNYAAHAAETGLTSETPEPLIFTKFLSSLASPQGVLALPTNTVDWEVELVAVIGTEAFQVREEDAWEHVAGLTLGQDYSERTLQMRGTPPQFSLAKSYPGFTPLGPVLVSTDEFDDLDDLAIQCRVNGHMVQSGRTNQLIHSIPKLVAHLSSVCALSPGDLIFTGTPEGVGMGHKPPIYLKDGDEVLSRCAPIGELFQQCVAAAPASPRERQTEHG